MAQWLPVPSRFAAREGGGLKEGRRCPKNEPQLIPLLTCGLLGMSAVRMCAHCCNGVSLKRERAETAWRLEEVPEVSLGSS